MMNAPLRTIEASGNGMLMAHRFDTPLDSMVVVASERGVVLLEFRDRRALEAELREVRRLFSSDVTPGENEHTREAVRQLGEYFAGGRRAFELALDLRGSAFQMRVWERLRRIPPGATASYGELARELGSTGGARAVGRANGQNRVAIVVPCHRVIQADGSLCGYGGGLWRKKWLLEHEGARERGGLFHFEDRIEDRRGGGAAVGTKGRVANPSHDEERTGCTPVLP